MPLKFNAQKDQVDLNVSQLKQQILFAMPANIKDLNHALEFQKAYLDAHAMPQPPGQNAGVATVTQH